jgi:penicillin-binding protein 1A
LGKKETGGSVALPAFISFMKEALKDKPNTPFRVPKGIQFVKVDLHTGVPVSAAGGEGTVTDETYITGKGIAIPGVTPKGDDMIDQVPSTQTGIENTDAPATVVNQAKPPIEGTGGLY